MWLNAAFRKRMLRLNLNYQLKFYRHLPAIYNRAEGNFASRGGQTNLPAPRARETYHAPSSLERSTWVR